MAAGKINKPDLFYPNTDAASPQIKEAIRHIYDMVYYATGVKGSSTFHDTLKVKKDLDLSERGSQLRIKECDNAGAGVVTDASMGVSTLVAGQVTVKNTLIRAKTRVFLTPQNTGTAQGHLYISARATGVSFTIKSTSGTDDREVAWLLIQPSGLNQTE